MPEVHETKTGQRLRGLVAGGDMTVAAAEARGDSIANVVFRDDSGQNSDRLLAKEQLEGVEVATWRRWEPDKHW